MFRKSILALVMLLVAGQARAIDLGGIPLGGSIADALVRYPDAACEEKTGETVFDKKCGTTGQLAEKPVTLVFQSKDGRVGSINAVFTPDDYDAILGELTGQLGAPSSSRDGMALWKNNPDQTLVSIEKNSMNIPGSGLLMLMDLRFQKNAQR